MRSLISLLMLISIPTFSFADYKPSKFTTIELAFENLGEFSKDNGTFKLLSHKPSHIQVSPRVLKAESNEVIKESTCKALLYGVYRTFIHTDVENVKVTAVPIDLQTKETYNGFKETISISRDKALRTAIDMLGIKNLR